MTSEGQRQGRTRRLGAAAVLGTLLTGACGEAPAPAPPAPEVRVVTVEAQPVSRSAEIPGRLQAVRTSEVRARVDGYVQRRVYAEGTDVKAGQVLFEIDPRELQAALNAAEAALARAEAVAANAEQDVARYEGLVERQAISRQEYDAAVARARTARADVAATKAQVEAARLNLSYATVTAPIGGRAGRAMVTEGALVSRGAGTLLTTIEQLDPIYVNFSQLGSEIRDLMRMIEARGTGGDALRRVAVRLVLEDGTVYQHPGHINFLDLSIDEQTGTTALRAVFPNPERVLLPGQFVRVQIQAPVSAQAIQVPQRAVTLSGQGASVMVVGANDVVEARPVTVGELRSGVWEIVAGLQPGERVVVDGLQKIRPGAAVRVAAEAPAVEQQPTATAEEMKAQDS